MRDSLEIVYNFNDIAEAIKELKALYNRAEACSKMKYEMQESKGKAKEALLDTYEAITDVAASTATMLNVVIKKLEYANNRMKEEDKALSRKLKVR